MDDRCSGWFGELRRLKLRLTEVRRGFLLPSDDVVTDCPKRARGAPSNSTQESQALLLGAFATGSVARCVVLQLLLSSRAWLGKKFWPLAELLPNRTQFFYTRTHNTN